MTDSTVKTVNGSVFTMEQSQQLANLIYQRFGFDIDAASNAWRRLLENNCSNHDFEKLIRPDLTLHEAHNEEYYGEVVKLIEAFNPNTDVSSKFVDAALEDGLAPVQAAESWFAEYKYDVSKLTGIEGKMSEFSEEVKKLQRPYIKISKEDNLILANGVFDYYQLPTGQVVTFGYADDGFALMPLQREYAQALK